MLGKIFITRHTQVNYGYSQGFLPPEINPSYSEFSDENLRKLFQDIETCPGCYLGPLKSPETNWFTKVCDIIHPIVWGKIAGYPIWPGKAVGYKKEKQSGK